VILLKKLGKVFIVNKNNNILVKVTKSHRLNATVVNQQLKKVGKIVDVIGPVNSPYLVVNTRDSEAKAAKGSMVYLLETSKKKSQPTKKKSPSKSKPKTKPKK
jgi:RNA-binding protein